MRTSGLLLLIILLSGCATPDACYWRARAVSEGAPDLYTQPEAERDCLACERVNNGGAQ